PYRYEVIGEKKDLLSITREDLYEHYRGNYAPNNALLCAAGDFDSQAMLEKIRALYGGIPAAGRHSAMIEPETPLQAERRVELSGAGGTTYIQLAYRSPAASSQDFFWLTVLDSLLTGPSSLSMFGGGGVSNRTSRLYQALVDRDYAVAVNGSLQATIDPFLYTMLVVVHPNRAAEEVLAETDAQIARVLNERVSPDEIARAVKQAKALFAYSTESITNQAFWLGYAEMFAQYDWFLNYIESLEQADPDKLLQTAQKYLNPASRVVGIFRPTDEGGAA
ncbi:MAG: insulinase family protein, partial [Anaerolineaceae bacterium]